MCLLSHFLAGSMNNPILERNIQNKKNSFACEKSSEFISLQGITPSFLSLSPTHSLNIHSNIHLQAVLTSAIRNKHANSSLSS